jgi:hypothetical protein
MENVPTEFQSKRSVEKGDEKFIPNVIDISNLADQNANLEGEL